VTDAADTLNWTTDPVDLPGTDPADPPTELVPGKLWHGGCPVDFDWVRDTGIDLVVDLADADAYPPAAEVDGLTYLKCPLVDGDDLPDPALTLRLAALVAGLVDDGHQALVHCTFGRNRSGLLVTLVVRELLHLSGRDALTHVRDRRDRAVNNETFAEWLTSLSAPEGQSGVRHSRSSASIQSSESP
jgi:Dual specificity phosphatase, catalytic domain